MKATLYVHRDTNLSLAEFIGISIHSEIAKVL